MSINDPRDTHVRFTEAANAADLLALAALYEQDAVIVERDGTLAAGADAIRHHLEGLIAMHPQMKILESRAFTNGDLALLCSHWKATATPSGGNEVTLEFRGSEIVHRQTNGTWLLVLDNPWGVDVAGS
ncbi:MAG: YybH family protein [Acidimicrobiales bacterium]